MPLDTSDFVCGEGRPYLVVVIEIEVMFSLCNLNSLAVVHLED